jgi:hypothetical protein
MAVSTSKGLAYFLAYAASYMLFDVVPDLLEMGGTKPILYTMCSPGIFHASVDV